MKKLSVLLVCILVSPSCFALSATLDGAARDSNGNVIQMSHPDAIDYCAQKGSRLPTAYEFASLANSLGAEGIRETAYPDQNGEAVEIEADKNAKDGYVSIYRAKTLPSNCQSGCTFVRTISFYYNNLGYKRPLGSAGDFGFWTSDFNQDFTDAYAFFGDTGDIQSFDYVDHEAVRCVIK